MAWITRSTFVGEFDPDDFEQISGVIGSVGKHLRWIGVWLEVDDGDCMLEGEEDGGFVDAMPGGSAVYFHISIS